MILVSLAKVDYSLKHAHRKRLHVLKRHKLVSLADLFEVSNRIVRRATLLENVKGLRKAKLRSLYE